MFAVLFVLAVFVGDQGYKCYEADVEAKQCVSDLWANREASYKVNR